MARHRIVMTRAGWRKCVFGFAYYLCAVIILENLLAIVYWNNSSIRDVSSSFTDDDGVRDETEQKQRSYAEVNSTRTAASIHLSPQSIRPADLFQQKTIASTTLTTTSRSLTLQEQETEFYQVRKTRVNPYMYNVILRPKNLCDAETFMVIIVHSHHPNTDRRAAIRSTWGSIALNGSWPNLPRLFDEKIKLVFMLGTHKDEGLNDLIHEEWRQFDDVVQGNFYDSYQNMTLKSLLGLKLVSGDCPAAKYLLKTDDDMFINVPYLVNILRNRTVHRSIMGPLNVGSKVYRTGKWKLSKKEFPFQFYPPYESGAAYLITCDIVRELYETSEYVPSIFIDDVYITGILGRILNVTHERQQGFAYWTTKPPSACDITENRIISGTKMTPPLLLSTWEEIKRRPSCKTMLHEKTTT